MRHQKAGKKLNRTGSHRNAMFRNMVTSLFTHGRIRTTDAKAKELRRWVDRMITLAKRGDLHARRQALAVMRDKAVVHKLFEEAQERFGDRSGGYTNLIKIGKRLGDAAPISVIELVRSMEKKEGKKKKSKSKKVAEKVKKKTAAEDKGKEEKKQAKATRKQGAAKAKDKTATAQGAAAGGKKSKAGSEGAETKKARVKQEKTEPAS